MTRTSPQWADVCKNVKKTCPIDGLCACVCGRAHMSMRVCASPASSYSEPFGREDASCISARACLCVWELLDNLQVLGFLLLCSVRADLAAAGGSGAQLRGDEEGETLHHPASTTKNRPQQSKARNKKQGPNRSRALRWRAKLGWGWPALWGARLMINPYLQSTGKIPTPWGVCLNLAQKWVCSRLPAKEEKTSKYTQVKKDRDWRFCGLRLLW